LLMGSSQGVGANDRSALLVHSPLVFSSGDNIVILNSLEELHGEEKEDTRRQLEVVGTSMHPPGREQADGGKARRHFTSETHLSTQVPQRTNVQ